MTVVAVEAVVDVVAVIAIVAVRAASVTSRPATCQVSIAGEHVLHQTGQWKSCYPQETFV